MLSAFAPEFKPEMARLLQPKEGMNSRNLPGGTGPEAVRSATEAARRRLEEIRARSR